MPDSIQPFGLPASDSPSLREAFDQSIGSTFYRQMLKSLRSSTGKPAYFHGGQAEEIFQSQLDEILISDLAGATGDSFSSELFRQQFPDHQSLTSDSPKTDNSNATPPKSEAAQGESTPSRPFEADA